MSFAFFCVYVKYFATTEFFFELNYCLLPFSKFKMVCHSIMVNLIHAFSISM